MKRIADSGIDPAPLFFLATIQQNHLKNDVVFFLYLKDKTQEADEKTRSKKTNVEINNRGNETHSGPLFHKAQKQTTHKLQRTGTVGLIF